MPRQDSRAMAVDTCMSKIEIKVQESNTNQLVLEVDDRHSFRGSYRIGDLWVRIVKRKRPLWHFLCWLMRW